MSEIPVGFIYFLDENEATGSQAIQYCHDKEHDIADFYQYGYDIVGFFARTDVAVKEIKIQVRGRKRQEGMVRNNLSLKLHLWH